MCVCVRARARAREARAVILTSESDFWEMRVLSGFAPVWLHGLWSACTDLDFWFLAKPVKFYRHAYMFWWNWFSGFEKNTSFELSRTNILCDETDETKKSHRTKNLDFLRNEWSSFDRLLQPESTTRGSGIMTISYRKPKNLNRLRISLALDKVLFLATSASGTWFSEINIFGVRYVLTYSPNHSSASGCKTLRSSMVYEVLKWHTKTAWMLCATPQCVSVPCW